jgi:RNA-directed DNA polymerase
VTPRDALGIISAVPDDFVVGFKYESDARRFWDALRARLAGFALALHPDKTRLIEFDRHAAERRAKAGRGKPETFKFLGFGVLQRHTERRATQHEMKRVVQLRER